eukprot:gene7432-566_t
MLEQLRRLVVRDDGAKDPPARASQKHLYIDGLNIVRDLFVSDVGEHWQTIVGLQDRVDKFVAAAEMSGFTSIVVFIDAFILTDETDQKWRERRIRDVDQEKRDVPQAVQILLGEAFQEAGVEVKFSLDQDNDDTLAAYAQICGAEVLSEDRDFFRYIGHKYTVFRTFPIDPSGCLLLEVHPGPTICTLCLQPAGTLATSTRYIGHKYTVFHTFAIDLSGCLLLEVHPGPTSGILITLFLYLVPTTCRYIGRKYTVFHTFAIDLSGCLLLEVHPGPTSGILITLFLYLVPTTCRYIGRKYTVFHTFAIDPSGCLLLEPLRAALYSQLGLSSSDLVQEVFPQWDDDLSETVFVEEDVQPDPEYLDLLMGDPYEALAHFFPYEAVNDSPPPHIALVCDDVKSGPATAEEMPALQDPDRAHIPMQLEVTFGWTCGGAGPQVALQRATGCRFHAAARGYIRLDLWGGRPPSSTAKSDRLSLPRRCQSLLQPGVNLGWVCGGPCPQVALQIARGMCNHVAAKPAAARGDLWLDRWRARPDTSKSSESQSWRAARYIVHYAAAGLATLRSMSSLHNCGCSE